MDLIPSLYLLGNHSCYSVLLTQTEASYLLVPTAHLSTLDGGMNTVEEVGEVRMGMKMVGREAGEVVDQ